MEDRTTTHDVHANPRYEPNVLDHDPPQGETPVGLSDNSSAPQRDAKARRAVREIVETIILAVVIFVAVRAVVLNFKVDGRSMLPNLVNHEMLLVNRNVYFHFDSNEILSLLPGEDSEVENIVYLFHPPERGDIIVFEPPTAVPSTKPYIKRVIGLPGDTVVIRNGSVFVNDVELDEPYIEDGITTCRGERQCAPVEVPEGTVYVLGDNREDSSDSRAFGPVPIDNIIGKAWITYWPPDEFGIVPHYDYPELSG